MLVSLRWKSSKRIYNEAFHSSEFPYYSSIISQIVILQKREQLKSILLNALYYVFTTATIFKTRYILIYERLFASFFFCPTQPVNHKIRLNWGNSQKKILGKKFKINFNLYLPTCSLRSSTSCISRTFCFLNAANSSVRVSLFLKTVEDKQKK